MLQVHMTDSQTVAAGYASRATRWLSGLHNLHFSSAGSFLYHCNHLRVRIYFSMGEGVNFKQLIGDFL